MFSSALLCRGLTGALAGTESTAASWLKIGVGGRAAGMGEAYSAACSDAGAIFWNPARLAGIDGYQLITQYGRWLVDTGYHAAGYARPLSDKEGVVGIGMTYFDSGRMRYIRDVGDLFKSDSELGAADWFRVTGSAAYLSYGRKTGSLSEYGMSVKVVSETILNRTEVAVAFDAGAYFPLGNGIALSALAQNVGAKMRRYSLPSNMKLGAAKTLGRVLATADLNLPSDSGIKLNTGVEIPLGDKVTLRGGLMFGRFGAGYDASWSAGAGFLMKKTSVDLAYVPYGLLGDTLRASMTIKF